MKRKMIFSFFFGLFLLLSSFNVFAQETGNDVKVDWGKEFEDRPKTRTEEVIGSIGEYIYTTRTEKTNFDRFVLFAIEIFKKDGTLVLTKEINNQEIKVEFFTIFKNRLFLFHSAGSFQVQELNKETLALEGISKEISETEFYSLVQKRYRASTPKEKRMVTGEITKLVHSKYFTRNPKYSHQISDSNEYLLVYEKHYSKFVIWVFDAELNLLWEKKVEVDDEYVKRISLKKTRIDDNGNVYHIIKIINKNKGIKNEGRSKVAYEIWAYKNEGSDVKKYKIDLEDASIEDINFEVKDNNKIVCSGFYSEKPIFRTELKGLFYIVINLEDDAIEVSKQNNFSKDFLGEFIITRKVAKDKGLLDFKIDKIVVQKNGRVSLIAEQYFITHSQTTDNKGSTSYYNYGDFIILSISPTGTIEWFTRVPKKQVTAEDGGYFSSYVHIVNGENIYLLYNDSPRNLDSDENKTYKTRGTRYSVAILSTISPDGNHKRSVISDNKEEGIMIRPKTCKQITANEMLIYAKWRGKNRVGVLTVE